MAEQASADLLAVRGKTVKKVPPVEIVNGDEWTDGYVIPSFKRVMGENYADTLDLFKALGMIPEDLDADRFVRQWGTSLAIAAYDFLKCRILIPSREKGRAAEPAPDTLVHEMTHALADQDYQIAKLMSAGRGSFDRAMAVGALIEGEATNVQIRYGLGGAGMFAGVIPYGTLRKEARARFDDIERQVIRWMPDVPPNIIRANRFLYDEGVLFVERLRRRQPNWAAVDDAYRNPPRSTSQVFHPEKYVAGEQPVEMDVAEKDKLLTGYAVHTENTLGELGMRLFVMTHFPKLAAPERRVEGWRGDRAVLYRRAADKREVLVWVSTWDTPESAKGVKDLLDVGLQQAAAKDKARVVASRQDGCDVIVVLGDAEAKALLAVVKIVRK
jgi:hypothetical protein